MATKDQSKYISDLAIVKTKEFKEVKELLFASGIVSKEAEIIKNAQSIAEINHALTNAQANQLIEVLISTKEPNRSSDYSKRRVETTVSLLDDIKNTINKWNFDGLR